MSWSCRVLAENEAKAAADRAAPCADAMRELAKRRAPTFEGSIISPTSVSATPEDWSGDLQASCRSLSGLSHLDIVAHGSRAILSGIDQL